MKIPTQVTEKFTIDGIKRFFADHQNWMLVVIVFGLAFFLRLWQLASIPSGVSASELPIIQKLSELNANHLWLSGGYYQGAYLYLAFIWTRLFGFTVYNLRVLSALLGSLTVYLSYIFIAQWFSKKIAIFSAFLLAISSFHITLSRLLVPDIILPVILLLLFSILTVAYRKKSMWLFGIGGLLTGLGLYCSPAFLLVPVLFAISGFYFYLKNPKFIFAYRRELIVSLIAFVSVITPYVVSFAQTPNAYLTYFGFNRSVWQLVMNIGQIPNLLFLGTSPNFFLNMGSEPLLDPFIFIAGVAGFFFALMRLERRKYFFMIAWLVIFSLYAALKRGVQIIDLLGVMPVIFAFAALILDYVIDKWFKTFPLNKNAQVAAVGLIAIFFSLSALYNFNRYFVAYKNSDEVKKEFSATSPIPLK